MARQSGIFNFEGTLDNVTFYKTADGLLVRKKGGVSKQRIKTDPAFVRTRENGAEFGNCATSASKLRQAISSMVHKASDSKLSSRLIKVFFTIKKMDMVNVRGERSVGQGLTTPSGKAALKDFDFNKNAKLHTVLSAPFDLDVLTGKVTYTDLNPIENINFPDGASHFSLQCAVLHLDLIAGISEVGYSPLLNFPLSNGTITPLLVPSSVPTATGAKIHLVLLAFYQEINGLQYSLNNGAFNALNIIEVL